MLVFDKLFLASLLFMTLAMNGGATCSAPRLKGRLPPFCQMLDLPNVFVKGKPLSCLCADLVTEKQLYNINNF